MKKTNRFLKREAWRQTSSTSIYTLQKYKHDLYTFTEFLNGAELAVKPLKIQKALFLEEEKELTRKEYERLVKAAQQKKNQRLSRVIQTINNLGGADWTKEVNEQYSQIND